MKKLISMLVAICLLLALFACSNADQEAIYSSALAEGKGESAGNAVQSVQSMAPASEDDLSGELTLRTPVAGDTLNYYAIFFHQLHPNVTIHVEPTFTDAAEWARNPQRHTEQLAVELMSGEAGDLVDIGMMTYAKYASSGLFEDLNQWMDNDPDIHREDFYQNVLGELEIHGELFQMPVNWNYITLYFNLNMTTDLGVDVLKRFPDGVNYKQAVELFEEMKEAGIITEETFFAPNQSAAFFDEIVAGDFVDLESGTCTFDSPEFVDYLEAVDSLPWDHTMKQGMDYGSNWIMFSPRDYFCNRYVVSVQSMAGANGQTAGLSCTPAILCRTVGGGYPFQVSSSLAITSFSENKELAWEFIKFVVNTREFPEEIKPYNYVDGWNLDALYCSYMPVNRENYLGAARGMGWSDLLIQQFDEYNKQMDTYLSLSAELNYALLDIKEDFFDNNLITAEECAQQMQERAELYLKE